MNYLVSLIIRSHNDSLFLKKNIEKLKQQKSVVGDHTFELEFIHIDNASSDDSCSIIQEYNPHATLLKWNHCYVPGKVLNHAIKACHGTFIVFHNGDAIACNENYLSSLIQPLIKGDVDVTFAQQCPRNDAYPWVRYDYERAFGSTEFSKRHGHFFSLVSAGVKASILKENLFDETYEYSEDVEWASRLKSKGFRVQYAPEATVEHSHNYCFKNVYKRFFNEGVAMRKMGGAAPSFIREILFSLPVALLRDFLYMFKHFYFFRLPSALIYRCIQRYALLKGRAQLQWRKSA